MVMGLFGISSLIFFLVILNYIWKFIQIIARGDVNNTKKKMCMQWQNDRAGKSIILGKLYPPPMQTRSSAVTILQDDHLPPRKESITEISRMWALVPGSKSNSELHCVSLQPSPRHHQIWQLFCVFLFFVFSKYIFSCIRQSQCFLKVWKKTITSPL